MLLAVSASAAAASADCGAGTHLTNVTNTSLGCLPCPLGHYCEDGIARSCPHNTYQPSVGAFSEAACRACPAMSTSDRASTSLDDCLCGVGFFMRPARLGPRGAEHGRDSCFMCPQPGTNCSEVGMTVERLELSPGYWRNDSASVEVLPCPDSHREEDSACGGGVAPCREGLNTSGIFCTLCPDDHYKEYEGSRCVHCDHATYSLALPLLLALVVVLVVSLLLLYSASQWGKAAVRRLGRRAKRQLFESGLDVDLKLLWSFYQVVSTVPDVYRIQAPEQVRAASRSVYVDPSLGLGNLLACAGLGGFLPSLIFWVITPIVASVVSVGVALGLAWRRKPKGDSKVALKGIAAHSWVRDGLRNSLPPVLLIMFVAYTPAASLAARAFDCHALPRPHGDLGGGDDDGGGRYLRADYAVECGAVGDETDEYRRVRAWAVLATAVYVVGVPLASATLLYFARDALRREQPVPLSDALAFLHKAYEPHVFWWELMEFGRKWCLTALAVLFYPGSVMQLAFAIIVSVTFLALHMEAQPFMLESNDHVAFSIDLFLCFLFFFCLVIKVQVLVETLDAATYRYLATPSAALALFETDAWRLTGLMLGSLLVTLATTTIAFINNMLISRSRKTVLRWNRDNSGVHARPLLSGRSHVFISHNWKSGQDQSRSIKSALTGLVASMRVWLDVDDMRSKAGTKATNTSNFGAVIDTAEAMIAFMAGSQTEGGGERSDYFLSPPCQQELRRAVSTKTPIIWVYETDPLHGGISRETHLRDCPDDLRPELKKAFDTNNVIDWHRIRSFQDVSLRLMLQKILAKEAEERGGDTVYVPTEVTRAPLRLAPPPPPPGSTEPTSAHNEGYHVYVSEHNPGAVELMFELEDWLSAKRGGGAHERRAKSQLRRFSRAERKNIETNQKIICGPWALSPVPQDKFGVFATVKEGMNGGTWHARTASGEDVVLGDLSPLGPVTLPPATRDAVGISQDALYFAFAYPSPSDTAPDNEPFVEQVVSGGFDAGADAADVDAFRKAATIGGFAYFRSGADGQLEMCQSMAMSLGGGMHFAGPIPLGQFAPIWRDALKRAGRLHPVTLPVLLEAGVRYFAWLHSNEKVAPCEGGSWPDGAFVYFYDQSPEGEGEHAHGHRDCVFYLTQEPPEPESDGEEEEEREWGREKAGELRSNSITKMITRGGGGKHQSVDHHFRLKWTDDPADVDSCAHVLVYLDAKTHEEGAAHTAALHAELDLLLKRDPKVHMVLVHENRHGEHHGATFHGATFKSIIDATPPSLVRDPAGAKRLYQELAVPLFASEHFDVSATILIGALAGAHAEEESGRMRRLRKKLLGAPKPRPSAMDGHPKVEKQAAAQKQKSRPSAASAQTAAARGFRRSHPDPKRDALPTAHSLPEFAGGAAARDAWPPSRPPAALGESQAHVHEQLRTAVSV